MSNVHGIYDYTFNLTETLLGKTDKEIVIAYDVEVQVEIGAELSGGELECVCKDVMIDGASLANTGAFGKMLRTMIMQKVDDELAAGGSLLDQVCEAEGIYFKGHSNDPDARFVRSRL